MTPRSAHMSPVSASAASSSVSVRKEAAVARMPGAFGKGTFTAMFEWVKAKGYEGDEHFQKYVIRKMEEKEAAKKQ